MKTKKKVLIGLMALCLVGTTGSVLALTATAANGSINGNVDGAVYFNWGQNEIPAISSLKGGVRQYTYFSASTTSTKSVAGTVTLSFTLAPETNEVGKTAVLTGLTVRVYQTTAAAITAENVATYAVAGNLQTTLTNGSRTGNATFTVTADTTKHTTTAYYAVAFDYDGTKLGADEVLDGSVTITSSWANAA